MKTDYLYIIYAKLPLLESIRQDALTPANATTAHYLHDLTGPYLVSNQEGGYSARTDFCDEVISAYLGYLSREVLPQLLPLTFVETFRSQYGTVPDTDFFYQWWAIDRTHGPTFSLQELQDISQFGYIRPETDALS